ncbi:MAG: DUF3050 domain-containing protein, partial [Rhodobacterales bacterium]|nr:DUF3050 domain-containing protein [Rhodobacterales bacterium]
MPDAVDTAPTITPDTIAAFRARLDGHPVYGAVATVEDLRTFMRHHVYSVWDFMSLIKTLQAAVAPAGVPWLPPAGPIDADVQRFINELVLEEETDEAETPGHFTSHVALYLRAMEEVGADTGPVTAFLETVRARGIRDALETADIPAPSRAFTTTTFDIIGTGRPHEVAAALALGREHIIPGMFRAILARTGIGPADAPTFHGYLNRHIHLDEDFHAPMSLKLLAA